MRGTVLCVDNDRELIHILSKALEAEGYRVLSAYDGEGAVEIATGDEAPDLVLLDLILPRLDGFAVLEAIRRHDRAGQATPVVLLTGCRPSPTYQQRAASLGAAALLTKPLPLDRLLAVVSEHIAKGGAAAGSGAGGLAGSLSSLPFASLLHHLHGLRATGVLHLDQGRRRKWIELREGYPVAVRSNLVSECLGNFLVRTRRISHSSLEESRRRMVEGQLQGEILVAMDVLREEEIPAVLRAQAEEKLYEVFSWKSGSFHFEIGGRLQRANELPLGRSPANLVLEGVRARMPIERVDAHLRANGAGRPAPAESTFYRFQEIDLDADQEALMRSLDGSRPLASFLGAEEGVRRTLYALLATGMLELVGGPQPAAAADAAPRPPKAAPAPRPDDEALRRELMDLAERLRDRDPLEVLGLEPSATDAEIRRAYEGLAPVVHPDRVAGASAAVRQLAGELHAQIADAYETLVDPLRRNAYLLERRRKQRRADKAAEARTTLEAELQFQCGEAALRQRDYAKALEAFGRAVELYPDAGEYHAHYGWALHLSHPGSKGKLAEAVGHVRRGLKLARDSEKPYLFMGRLLKAADRTDASEKMFTRAVQIQPECFEALRELRLIKMRREKSKGIVGRLFRR
jgi:DNA-binding response OmpR family regulator/curved DNA-binding protein CbpA